jgi:type I restriction enzyme S subunit
MRPQETVHGPFIHHLLRSLPFQEEFYRNGKGIVADLWSTNYSEMRNILLGMPSLPEQNRIAVFLDRETEKIDTLVVEQHRLIDLLKEKRQAVISHAVTKGLNPAAPMKPSGIEWLGDIPAHWTATKIKFLCYVNDGNHGEEYPKESDYTDEDDGVPFIRGGNMENLSISPKDMLYISRQKNDSMRKGNIRTGDVLFMNRGEIGKVALVPAGFNGANLNSQIAYIRAIHGISSYYLLYFLCSGNIKSFIESMKMGSVLTQFPISDIINLNIPMPPSDEQQEIVNFVGSEVKRFDVLTTEAQRAIDLLQERRTALISAAVTGQIDVREMGSRGDAETRSDHQPSASLRASAPPREASQ